MFKIRGECSCNNDLWHWIIVEDEITLVCTTCGLEVKLVLAAPASDLLVSALQPKRK